MKKTWTSSPSEIRQELSYLINNKTPLTFCQHGGKANKVFVHDILERENNMLALVSDQELQPVEGGAILFYHAPQHPLKGFESKKVTSEGKKLYVSYPEEIFQVERRRISRIKTFGKSMVTFMVEGGARLSSCKVKDICLEGAQLIGNIHYKKETKLSPLTFTLGMRYENFEKIIIVSEASIVRLNDKQDGTTEYGIHFIVGDAEQDKLEEYIMLRKKEDSDLE